MIQSPSFNKGYLFLEGKGSSIFKCGRGVGPSINRSMGRVCGNGPHS